MTPGTLKTRAVMPDPDFLHLLKTKKYKALVSYIWRRRDRATRTDMARDLRLSNATVFPAVEYLMRLGVVEGIPAATGRKGRSPRLLRLCGAQCFAAGVSLHMHKADISLVNAAQQVIGAQTVDGLPRSEKDVLARVLAAIREMILKHKLDPARLAGVGVTLPGMIDCERGLVRRSSCFNGDTSVSITETVEAALRRPCQVMNSAAALALTEKEWGKAADLSTFLYFAGLGLGMFLNGQLFVGHQSFGGEIGFMKFGEGGAVGADGRAGTFNHLTPFRQMGLRLEDAIRGGARTLAADWIRAGRPPSSELVAQAAAQGDPLCRGLIAEGFEAAAEMIVGLNYLFNPQAIFLLPWTARCPDVSLDIVRRRLERCRAVNPGMEVQVLAAQNGREELSRGMAMLPLDRLFR